jgi:hypothetical protein
MRKYCTFSLFVIVFMPSDRICNHAWIVMTRFYPNAIWRFDGSMEYIYV